MPRMDNNAGVSTNLSDSSKSAILRPIKTGIDIAIPEENIVSITATAIDLPHRRYIFTMRSITPFALRGFADCPKRDAHPAPA